MRIRLGSGYAFNDAQIAHRAIAKRGADCLGACAVMDLLRIFQPAEFDKDRALAEPMFKALAATPLANDQRPFCLGLVPKWPR
jgi:hypothetical protein